MNEVRQEPVYTVEDFADRHPNLKLSTIRYWVKGARPRVAVRRGARVWVNGNGLEAALVRRGRKSIFIHEPSFWTWFYQKEGRQ